MPRTPPLEPTPIDAYNNVRHGLAARTIAIPGLEEHSDWINFRDAIMDSLSPEGAMENELALRVAEGLWRQRRVARHEQHLVDIERRRDAAVGDWNEYKRAIEAEAVAEAEPSHGGTPPPATRDLHREFVKRPMADLLIAQRIDADIKPERMLPGNKDLDRVMRYEAHLTRQTYHALHELQALQAVRRGESAPLARLSILGGA